MSALNSTPPERLWHYTNGSAACSIFEHKALWAGHLGYMNDTSEYNHAMALSLDVARRLVDEMPERRDGLLAWIRFLTDSPPVSWTPNVFAVSFSEEADLLSQWRAYAGGPGGPFSIGFTSELLQRRLIRPDDTTMWSLERCVYRPDEQTAVLENMFAEAFKGSDNLAGGSLSAETDAQREFRHIYGYVSWVAPLLKHPGFEEEREWRLLLDGVDLAEEPTARFIGRKDTLAPYIDFPLSDGEPIGDVTFVAGPGPQQSRASQALLMAALRFGIAGFQPRNSAIPYLP